MGLSLPFHYTRQSHILHDLYIHANTRKVGKKRKRYSENMLVNMYGNSLKYLSAVNMYTLHELIISGNVPARCPAIM